jgi:hypothetical protein
MRFDAIGKFTIKKKKPFFLERIFELAGFIILK